MNIHRGRRDRMAHDICDDILLEIFLGTPVISLFRFKCLSKKWYATFSSISFRSKYLSRRNHSTLMLPLGCFQSSFRQHIFARCRTLLAISFPTTGFSKFSDFTQTVGSFVSTSNGLILCGRHPYTYLVCDPVSGRIVGLPPVKMRVCDVANGAAGFHYEEVYDKATQSVSAKFKVVRLVQPLWYGMVLIETYSSNTRAWEESIVQCCLESPFHVDAEYPTTVMRGMFYWFAYGNFIVVYDPNDSTCHNWVWLLSIPPSLGVRNYVLGECEKDQSLLLALDHHPGFRVMKLKKDVHCYNRDQVVPSSEWTSLYFISYPPRPGMLIYDPKFPELYPRLIAFHPQLAEYILMRIGRRLFWMNLVSRREHHMSYDGEIVLDTRFHMFPYFARSWPWPPTLP